LALFFWLLDDAETDFNGRLFFKIRHTHIHTHSRSLLSKRTLYKRLQRKHHHHPLTLPFSLTSHHHLLSHFDF
jgi:hypothetical protein